MHLPRTEELITLAIQEDLANGDLSAESVFDRAHCSRAYIESRQDLVVCGLEVARAVFKRIDPRLCVEFFAEEGAELGPKTKLMQISGPTVSILAAERTALNFLQRLSGIATQSRRFAKRVKALGVPTRIADTRKTIPGWRSLEKYAVRIGGCANHRLSLGEHVMLKDNHIAAAGSIAAAVAKCRARAPHVAKIEVEVNNLAQVSEALEAKADVIMLDNMPPREIERAVALIDRKAVVEVSGGVTFDTLADYAVQGVDVISIGALTHSAKAADLSLTIDPLSP